MASVLLLYFHMVSEAGFSHSETVYLDPNKFDGFSFLNTQVDEAHEPEIDGNLIREGAVIYLLCDLNDMISEYDDSYLSQETTKKILHKYDEGELNVVPEVLNAVPEVKELILTIKTSETELDFEKYKEILDEIYGKYVLGTFKRVINNESPYQTHAVGSPNRYALCRPLMRSVMWQV